MEMRRVTMSRAGHLPRGGESGYATTQAVVGSSSCPLGNPSGPPGSPSLPQRKGMMKH